MWKSKTYLLICLVLGFFVSGEPGMLRAGESDSDQSITYICTDGNEIQVRYINTDEKSSAIVTVNGDGTRLEQIRAASGAKYSNGNLTWWEKGGTGLLMQNDEITKRDCKALS